MDIAASNPLLTDWTNDFPPFSTVRPEHFVPAASRLAKERMARIHAIASNQSPATFENTVEAYEATGGHIERLDALFGILCLTAGNDELQAVEADVSALLANHHADALGHRAFFTRLDSLFCKRHRLDLATDELRLLERLHNDYVRNGVHLAPNDAARFSAIKTRLAKLYVAFNQNILGATDKAVLTLTQEDELVGLPDFVRHAARDDTADLQTGRYVFTLKYSSVVSFLAYSSRRDLRERLWRAWVARCTEPEFDNRPIAQEVITLRHELAMLLGYKSFADYALSDRMAATPQAARELLERVWEPAAARCQSELADLQALAIEIGEPTKVEPWDWRFLTEKLRKRRFDIDMAFVSEHFDIDSTLRAAFESASRLFGVSFHERQDVTLYHPDVRLWELEREGRTIGYLAGDFYSRERKMSGAWESEFRMRCDGAERTLPFVVISASFPRGNGTSVRLGLDDVQTIFHEFGHALHSLLSSVRFTRLSGTRVARDFVEFPSHLLENWALDETLLNSHAKHYETGAPMPRELITSLRASRAFNEGYELVRYIASALIDLEVHSLEPRDDFDIDAIESLYFERLGVPPEADVNLRLPHFRHLFGGDDYAAGYYGYLWAQVLEADAFEAFSEAGNSFDETLANGLHDRLLSVGNSVDPSAAYRAFRGRDPDPLALARKRGIAH